jgi:hypothetical protein
VVIEAETGKTSRGTNPSRRAGPFAGASGKGAGVGVELKGGMEDGEVVGIEDGVVVGIDEALVEAAGAKVSVVLVVAPKVSTASVSGAPNVAAPLVAVGVCADELSVISGAFACGCSFGVDPPVVA